MNCPIAPRSNHYGYPLEYATTGSIGADIRAADGIFLPNRETKLIPTGLYIIDPTHKLDLQIRSRSGLSLKGIVVANAPATIDLDYEGEIKVILHNQSNENYMIEKGSKIAQLVASPFIVFNGIERQQIEREDKGFGSTGK